MTLDVCHCENLPMRLTDIFLAVRIENFELKTFNNFLIFAQNIDYGYTLEPSHVRMCGHKALYQTIHTKFQFSHGHDCTGFPVYMTHMLYVCIAADCLLNTC